ncbi:uncharacterized protein LOC122849790 [Aphidius gifuensis]|uniref:uncharacterized protein LOC122849790 n=1 Tax=Aphidius gifuensis TaxID=684658 RepID=UPI001CDD26D5|nr:uncharacterized protein LOC122849790 [Aphidius gifuensis]
MLNLLRQPLLKSVKIAPLGVENFGKPIPRVLTRSYSRQRRHRPFQRAVQSNHHPFAIPQIPRWVKTTMWFGLTAGMTALFGAFWYQVLIRVMDNSILYTNKENDKK